MSEPPVPIHIFREQARLTEKALAERDALKVEVERLRKVGEIYFDQMTEMARELERLRGGGEG